MTYPKSTVTPLSADELSDDASAAARAFYGQLVIAALASRVEKHNRTAPVGGRPAAYPKMFRHYFPDGFGYALAAALSRKEYAGQDRAHLVTALDNILDRAASELHTEGFFESAESARQCLQQGIEPARTAIGLPGARSRTGS